MAFETIQGNGFFIHSNIYVTGRCIIVDTNFKTNSADSLNPIYWQARKKSIRDE